MAVDLIQPPDTTASPAFSPKAMVAVVDCNNFFVSCERVFRPDLLHRPVVVLSNNDGCIISRSNEAKALGIKMGAPVFKVQDMLKQHQVVQFSANFPLYGDLSERVMNILTRHTARMEVYSIDEAFLELPLMPAQAYTAMARRIKADVEQSTGIPISIGLGPTKTLAKLAVEFAKKEPANAGVLCLSSKSQAAHYMARTSVYDVWGVGPRIAPKLQQRRIHTAADLRRADKDWVMRTFSKVLMQTITELNGTPCLDLETIEPDRKSICCSRSFGIKIEDYEQLRQSVCTYAARTGEKLRSRNLVAQHVSVFIRTNKFQPWQKQYSNHAQIHLATASDSSHELIDAATRALDEIYRPGLSYHKAGVLLTGLVPRWARQPTLFDPVDRPKMARLMQAVDEMNGYWGDGTVRYACEGIQKRWWMTQNYKSPRYTTQWDQLLCIT